VTTKATLSESQLSKAIPKSFVIGHARIALVAGLLFVFGVSATVWRTVHQYQTPGAFDHGQQGLCDFHNGIYFPAQALIHGESPYGPEYAKQYPVARQIPFFLPSVLLLHAPLAMLPLRVAEIVYFSFSVFLILFIASLIASLLAEARSTHRIRLDHVLSIAAVIVLSRGGHITLFDGYFTFELVLATLLAIHFGKRKPWVAAVALALIASKPNYILALGFLMLARGNVKAVDLACLSRRWWRHRRRATNALPADRTDPGNPSGTARRVAGVFLDTDRFVGDRRQMDGQRST
jgi:hypothetical protein